MTGPTRDAVDFRMDNTTSACDTFDEAFDEVTALHDALEEASQRYVLADASQWPYPAAAGRITKKDTATPVPTHTATPAPTQTPLPSITNTPGPTNTPAATNTSGPSPTATSTGIPTSTFTPSTGSGPQYAMSPNCNPWIGGACPPAPSSASCSRRIFLIPVIDALGNGTSPVTILGFALVYLEGYDGSCTGNSCDVRARFVKADVTTNAFAATYDPDSLVHFVKLVE
jgi:hypothetical protein